MEQFLHVGLFQHSTASRPPLFPFSHCYPYTVAWLLPPLQSVFSSIAWNPPDQKWKIPLSSYTYETFSLFQPKKRPLFFRENIYIPNFNKTHSPNWRKLWIYWVLFINRHTVSTWLDCSIKNLFNPYCTREWWNAPFTLKTGVSSRLKPWVALLLV